MGSTLPARSWRGKGVGRREGQAEPLGKVKHEGGKKFLPGDLGYKAFRTWIEDYAKVRTDKYKTKASLPRDTDNLDRFGTNIWLKLNNTPPAWGDRLLQATVYAWDAGSKTWETTPIAVSDRAVWGQGKLWQHTLTLLAPRGSARAKAWKRGNPTLPRGRYLVKVHVDRKDRLKDNWKAQIGKDDYVGQAEFTSPWREGYGAMTVVDAGKVRR